MKKRWGTLLLAGLLGTAVLSGCGSSASDSASTAAADSAAAETTTSSENTKEDLIFVNYRDIRDLNPHLYAGEMYAQEMLYEGLVNITADGFEGCLAESWDVSEDGKVYTFHIRPGVLFSDGEKCDAYAIKANFDAILENKDRHTWLEMMHLLVGVDAPNENTFVIKLSEPYYPLLTELGVTRPFAMISPKAMKDGSTKDGVEAYIGTGPYVLDEFVTDEYAIFKANFDAILENKDRHTWLEMMHLLVGVSAPDENTFVIELSEPYYPLLTELGVTRPFAMISPKAMKDGSTKDGVEAYIGTGPYVLDEFVTDEYAVFKANPTYWGEQPAIKTITVKVIPDNQTRILALEKGEIDMIFGKNMIDADAINQYLDSDKFTVELSDPTSTRQIVLNTSSDILSEKDVRIALQHATNKQNISDGIFYGLEKPADTLFAKTIPYCNIDLEPFTYDLELAGQILDDAGWKMGSGNVREKDGKQLNIDLLYNSDSVTEKSIAEYLQSEYQTIGVSLNIHGEEEQSYRDNMKAGNFDMVFNICWGTPYDPQSSLAAMRAPVYGDYAAQLGLDDKAEIDEAITEILITTDEDRRQELYTYVLTHLHEDAVYIPLTYECNKAIYRSDMKGFHFTQTQYEVPFQDFSF